MNYQKFRNIDLLFKFSRKISISGATGFTTRSDIGPARDSTDVPEAGPVGPAPKKAKEDVVKTKKEEDRDEATDELNDANYDEVSILIF